MDITRRRRVPVDRKGASGNNIFTEGQPRGEQAGKLTHHYHKKKRSRMEETTSPSLNTVSSPGSITPESSSLPASVAQSIFASPPEPLFNQKGPGSSTLLQESLESLSLVSSQNQFTLKDDKCQGLYRTGEPVAYFMYMSKHFNLPPDIQYRAIELFHRFMTKHVCELYDHVQSSKHTSSPIQWETVEQRLTHQITLRALSCLQLASKLSLHYKIISLGKARNFLASCGFRYTPSSLVQSEIRILKTLDYRVHGPTPLDFIEVLLEALGQCSSSFPIKQLYGISMKLLDTYYLSTPVIMEKIKQLSTSLKKENLQPSSSSSSHCLDGNVDFLLLAAGIIGAASFLLDHTTSDEIVENLVEISSIFSETIVNISSLLVEHVMTD